MFENHVFVVTMYRNGNPTDRHYLLGIYSRPDLAVANCEQEEMLNRPYIGEVLRIKVDGTMDDTSTMMIVRPLPQITLPPDKVKK